MKRILQYKVDTSLLGGKERYIFENWKYIDKSKFDFEFFAYDRHCKSVYDSLYDVNDKMIYAPLEIRESQDDFAEYFRHILDRGYDAVHLHTDWWSGFLIEDILHEYNIPKIIVHSHMSYVDLSDRANGEEIIKRHNELKKCFDTSYATDFCACSKYAADWLYGDKIPKDKIKIMKNAINIEPFLYNKHIRGIYRRKLGLEDSFVIGNIGRLCYQKNHSFLIDVFAEVLKSIPNSKLLIVGDGEFKDDLLRKANELRIIDNVIFTGFRTDADKLLQVMDVFCLPSRFEGLPIVLIEAQTAGLKCIASNAISDEVCISDNIMMLPLEIEKWKDSIVEISSGYVRKDMANVITEAGYNIKYQIKEVERLYEE